MEPLEPQTQCDSHRTYDCGIGLLIGIQTHRCRPEVIAYQRTMVGRFVPQRPPREAKLQLHTLVAELDENTARQIMVHVERIRHRRLKQWDFTCDSGWALAEILH